MVKDGKMESLDKTYESFVNGCLCKSVPDLNAYRELLHGAIGLVLETKELEEVEGDSGRGFTSEAGDVEFFRTLISSKVTAKRDRSFVLTGGDVSFNTLAQNILDATCKLLFQNRVNQINKLQHALYKFDDVWFDYLATVGVDIRDLRRSNVAKLVKRNGTKAFNQEEADKRDL
jgi:hypothetical protein